MSVCMCCVTKMACYQNSAAVRTIPSTIAVTEPIHMVTAENFSTMINIIQCQRGVCFCGTVF